MRYGMMFMAAAVAFAGVASAAPAANAKKLSPEELAARRSAALARTGGTVSIPGEGRMAFLNCQSRVPHEVVEKFGQTFGDGLSIGVSCAKEVGFSISGAESVVKRHACGIGVFVIDDAALPISLISPEAGWGAVNVAALATDGPDAARLARRFRLECQRVSSLVASGCCSQYKGSVLQPVRTIADLDDLVGETYTVDTLLSSKRSLKAFGITPARKMTYLRACTEGVAPAPTNEYQKAIWDKVHAVPKNPMKIEFDPKKGK